MQRLPCFVQKQIGHYSVRSYTVKVVFQNDHSFTFETIETAHLSHARRPCAESDVPPLKAGLGLPVSSVWAAARRKASLARATPRSRPGLLQLAHRCHAGRRAGRRRDYPLACIRGSRVFCPFSSMSVHVEQERVVNIKDITSGKARVLPQVFRKPSWRYRLALVSDPPWWTMQALHNLRNDYDMREKIGKGSFGVTWIAIEKKSQARHACKVKARSHARTGASAHAHPGKHGRERSTSLHLRLHTCARPHTCTRPHPRKEDASATAMQCGSARLHWAECSSCSR